MRCIIDVSDPRSQRVFADIVQATQIMEEQLGMTTADNILKGMQHQLGLAAGLSMSPDPNARQQIRDELLGLVAMASIYIKALTEST